jgi:hypothetical protein
VKVKAEELHDRVKSHGQRSDMAHFRMDLEEYVEKMFFEDVIYNSPNGRNLEV